MTITPLSNKTEILLGAENAVSQGIKFMQNTKEKMDIYFDKMGPSIVIEVEAYRNGYMDIRERGGRIRALTEITKDNVSYCKELLKLVDELHHLEGIKGGLAVNESEYMSATILEEGKPLPQVIYSNVKALTEQEQYIFDTLWNNSIPAEQRIKQIEEGIDPEITEVLHGPENTIKISLECFERVKKRHDSYGDHTLPSVIVTTLPIKEAYRTLKDRGIKTRFITEVTASNVNYCKELRNLVHEVRHLDGIKGNFGVSDNDYMANAAQEESQPVYKIIHSNLKTFIEQQQFFFEYLWNKALPAEVKIKEIEEGVRPEFIETIRDSKMIQDIATDLIRKSRYEVQVIFATANTFHRQERAGSVLLLRELAERNAVKVRILTPVDDAIKTFVKKIENEKTQLPYGKDSNFVVQQLEPVSQTNVSLLIVDKTYSLIVELRDDAKESSLESVGLATYSNSKATVSSYVSIFDSLWLQSELYEKLQVQDRMHKEFIDIAAHELRSPIQPIIGLADMLRLSSTDQKQRELIDIIIRNAERLQQLTENLLDVTRIESNSLGLNQEIFSMKEVIRNVAQDIKNSIIPNDVQLSIYSSNEFDCDDDIVVTGDKARITQVIYNLLSNAIKSAPQGIVSITLDKNYDGRYLVVSIKDNGRGIDASIFPKLFEKFVSKSEKGTGLGLFISKGIIEAHGGRIWAENNEPGKGATFAFSLPLVSQ